ncbi:MAG: hypothetical protein GXP61_00620 [Epsilonproteobacteria bacterium]|nr:hypothetical protein [Campylobacterota bacterium]
MKIALMCNSLLLTKTLEIFLKKNISTYKKCDFVISDQKLELDKPQFIVSGKYSNLQFPFSQSSLIIGLDKFYDNLYADKEPSIVSFQSSKEQIKQKITILIEKFKDDLMDILDEK